MNLFDLNIEKVLDHWTNADATREIIANALDEQTLSHTGNIVISKDSYGRWHIIDYGRGIQPRHFTQNESSEKKDAQNLIGRFGVGLKDALGVLYNNGIHVTIDSKYGHITLRMAKKDGFGIQTLHACFQDPMDPNRKGTEFILDGLTDQERISAQEMFLIFNNETLLETTRHGQIYKRRGNVHSYIYINGVRVAEEENFRFSYNITELNTKIRKSMNRERNNVGRSAYTDSVKKILLSASSDEVLSALIEDVEENLRKGTAKDESHWTDVTCYAVNKLDQSGRYVFRSPKQRDELTNDQTEILKESGKSLISVPDSVIYKIGNNITTFDNLINDYRNTFQYDFIDESDRTEEEKSVFILTREIKSLLRKGCGFKTDIPVLISETIQIDSLGLATNGLCDFERERIIIKRSVLKDRSRFCGVLAHELCHYQHGHRDNTREFENDLTDALGGRIDLLIL